MATKLPKLTVASAAKWRQWLADNATSSKGVMLRTVKNGDKKPSTSLTYPEALDEGLCYGWIDSGGGGRQDDGTYFHRFTARKPKSLWSKRNVGFIEWLEREGRMQPPGRAVVEAAKADGRWDAAYAGSATDEAVAEAMPDFLDALKDVPNAQATWEALNKANRWKIYFTFISLRTQAGRQKSIKRFVEMLDRGETPLPQKTAQPRKVVKAAQSRAALTKAATVKQPSTPVTELHTRQTRSGRRAPSYVDQG